MNAKEIFGIYVDSIGIKNSVVTMIKNDYIMRNIGYYDNCPEYRCIDRIEVLTDMLNHIDKVRDRIGNFGTLTIIKIMPLRWVNYAYDELNKLIEQYCSVQNTLENDEPLPELMEVVL